MMPHTHKPQVGVDEVVLAVNYKPETMAAEMAEIEKKVCNA